MTKEDQAQVALGLKYQCDECHGLIDKRTPRDCPLCYDCCQHYECTKCKTIYGRYDKRR